MISAPGSTISGWLQGARALGFTAGAGREHLHRLGMTLEEAGGWAALSHPLGEDEHGVGRMGLPGLWRRLDGGRAEFDIPPREALPAEVAFESLLDWALATADGRVPSSWKAPPEGEVAEAAGVDALVVRAGGEVARGEFRRGRNRLALRFSKLVLLGRDLPPIRREWVEAMTNDAQRRWHMVRIGPDADGAFVGAEVDLTGAPPAALPALIALGAESLRVVISWVLPSLRVAADPNVESELLKSQP